MTAPLRNVRADGESVETGSVPHLSSCQFHPIHNSTPHPEPPRSPYEQGGLRWRGVAVQTPSCLRWASSRAVRRSSSGGSGCLRVGRDRGRAPGFTLAVPRGKAEEKRRNVSGISTSIPELLLGGKPKGSSKFGATANNTAKLHWWGTSRGAMNDTQTTPTMEEITVPVTQYIIVIY